jgi:DNA-binding NtrC family response regulator
VETPPLRDRPDDLPLLAHHFLGTLASEMGRPAPPITPEAMRLLRQHSFPGNVRELKNCLERALILSGAGPIEPAHLQFLGGLSSAPATSRATAIVPEDLPLNLEAAEQALIQRALAQTGGNVVEAARLLGVNRSRIYRRFPQGPQG